MADDFGSVRKQIAALKREIGQVEATRNEWAQALPELNELAALGDPDIIGERDGAEAVVAEKDKTLAKLHNELAQLEATLPKQAEPAAPKFDPEKHPLLKKVTDKVEPAKPITFNAGDLCEAQWTDKQWYKVKVQTVLGSASDPKYHVRFIDYKDSTLTVGRDSVRPLVSEKKRKAEVAPPTPTVATASSSPHVISGPASINPNTLAAKKEGTPDTSVPVNRRKIGGNKALERKANDWKNFTSKGKGKVIAKKESMFRSGTSVGSRVGFTGSGAGMTETHKRVRYNGKGDDEDDTQDSNGIGKSLRENRKDDWQSRNHY